MRRGFGQLRPPACRRRQGPQGGTLTGPGARKPAWLNRPPAVQPAEDETLGLERAHCPRNGVAPHVELGGQFRIGGQWAAGRIGAITQPLPEYLPDVRHGARRPAGRWNPGLSRVDDVRDQPDDRDEEMLPLQLCQSPAGGAGVHPELGGKRRGCQQPRPHGIRAVDEPRRDDLLDHPGPAADRPCCPPVDRDGSTAWYRPQIPHVPKGSERLADGPHGHTEFEGEDAQRGQHLPVAIRTVGQALLDDVPDPIGAHTGELRWRFRHGGTPVPVRHP